MPRVPQTYADVRTGEILDAAVAVFARIGLDRASMQDVARQADVSVGTLYRYFDSKDALLRAVCDRDAAAQMQGPFEQAVDHGGSPMQVLSALGTALLADEPEHIRMSINA